jgi:hypothetical protein
MAASVKQRLLDLSRARGEDFGLLLGRYGIERLLYRLSQSEHRDEFVLKGAMLFHVWANVPYRPTRDIDLLGRGEPDPPRLASAFRDVCAVIVDDDGIDFNTESVRASPIRERAIYDGVRVVMDGRIGSAIIRIQIDVGFGDVVVPPPCQIDLPAILDLPSPSLIAYRPETVVAEKLQAIVDLGMASSRMKDFFDLGMIARSLHFKGPDLARAIEATFSRRRTPLASGLPLAFTGAFMDNPTKQSQWQAFLGRTRIDAVEISIGQIVDEIKVFLVPPLEMLAAGGDFDMSWDPGGPWK